MIVKVINALYYCHGSYGYSLSMWPRNRLGHISGRRMNWLQSINEVFCQSQRFGYFGTDGESKKGIAQQGPLCELDAPRAPGARLDPCLS